MRLKKFQRWIRKSKLKKYDKRIHKNFKLLIAEMEKLGFKRADKRMQLKKYVKSMKKVSLLMGVYK